MNLPVFRPALVLASSFALLACNSPAPGPSSSGVTLDGPITLAEPVKLESPVDVNLPGPVDVQGAVSIKDPIAVAGPVAVEGTVALAGPIQLQQPLEVSVPQPLKVITADTDASQLVYLHGRLATGNGPRVKLLEGPFVLTDATNAYTYSAQPFRLYVMSGDSCEVAGSPPMELLASLPDSNASLHGARAFVPAGSSLCIHAYGSIPLADYTVSGFRPY